MANFIEFLTARIAEDKTPGAGLTELMLRLHTFAERDNQLRVTGGRSLRYHRCVAWDGEDPGAHFDTICETLRAAAAPYSGRDGYDMDWLPRLAYPTV